MVNFGDQVWSRSRIGVTLRAELNASKEATAFLMPITGIGQAWELADPARRRQLLGLFFEKLYVSEGGVETYIPRRDYRDEIETVVAPAVGAALEYEVPITGRGANLRKFKDSTFGVGGKGGVLLLLRLNFELAIR